MVAGKYSMMALFSVCFQITSTPSTPVGSESVTEVRPSAKMTSLTLILRIEVIKNRDGHCILRLNLKINQLTFVSVVGNVHCF